MTFPVPIEVPETNGVISNGDGDPTVDIDSPLRPRTDISTILNDEMSTLIHLGEQQEMDSPSHHCGGGHPFRAFLVSVVFVPVCLVNNFLRDNFLSLMLALNDRQ